MIWAYRTSGFLFASPAVANGRVYIGSYDGNIYALGTASASHTQQTNQPHSHPFANKPYTNNDTNNYTYARIETSPLPSPNNTPNVLSIQTTNPTPNPSQAALTLQQATGPNYIL
jgi:outer membrane protein assembly factor BamB